MHSKTRTALLQRSLPTDLIEKIESLGHTVTQLQQLSKAELHALYDQTEVGWITTKIQRQPIDEAVLERILAASGEVCAYCADGVSSRPYEIHHITPYSLTQDNSEGNLLLVCPTHHTWVHDRRESVDDQGRQRRRWYALREIANEYLARGLPFAFDRFVPIEFSGAPRPEELLSLRAPSPMTARVVSRHRLASQLEDQLRAENFVLLSGASGSGKSTLALAVAGGMPGARVLRYRPPRDDQRAALTEIQTLINTATKDTVLILDDVETWSSRDDVDVLRKVATTTVRLVATSTTTLGTSGQMERDAGQERAVLTWNAIKDPVREYFMANESTFANRLRDLRKTDTWRIGLGYHDRPLGSVLDEYLPKSSTVAVEYQRRRHGPGARRARRGGRRGR